MLAVARSTCESLLTGALIGAAPFGSAGPWFVPDPKNGNYMDQNPTLVASNGDAELWLKLCSLKNPPPVRAVTGGSIVSAPTDLFPNDPSFYGSNPVGNDQGEIDSSLLPTNLRPYCWRRSDPGYTGQQPPCPNAIDDGTLYLIPGTGYTPANPHAIGKAEMDRWATRGAINAGFAVFLYLDAIAKDPSLRVPDYTQCAQLP
jgi:hypothetical protein